LPPDGRLPNPALKSLKLLYRLAGSGDSGVCSPRSPSSLVSSPSPVPPSSCSIPLPLPPLHRPRHYDAHLSFIDRVVLEILDTEGVYVRDLHQIVVVSVNDNVKRFSHSYDLTRVAVISIKNHKRQSVTAKREKSQTPKVLTAILTLPNLT